ncbi:other/FunK1 protein kinase [Coprinopsis cinerea okayama7|uniref:Other/FunK1 protein kinase n=1 Tax=Coprinopsis cinerea (strain Okayama-7 / 130 / ATCC MYA-4618 / FGSC 9003) TaxID=240176 RepID=D6RPP2_COPC7|nr:other/FunK1 protein kinase [Coprinopsis cinerea okayama7\|eukprot:XP_002910499.1 other/FunK1 protein kinase [Coprinopsis cinerea okayama7\
MSPATPKRRTLVNLGHGGSLSEPIVTSTPRSKLNATNIDDTTTQLRLDIARLMNSEIVVCNVEEFIKYYMPGYDKDTVDFALRYLASVKREDRTTVLVPRKYLVRTHDGFEEVRVEAEDAEEESDEEQSPEDSDTEDESPSDNLRKEERDVDGQSGPTSPFDGTSGKEIEDEEYPNDFKDDEDDTDAPGTLDTLVYSHVLHDFRYKPSLVKKEYLKKKKRGHRVVRKVNEATLFNTLRGIGSAIRSCLEEKGVRMNGYTIRICGNSTMDSTIPGCDQRIDAGLTQKEGRGLAVSDVIVPFEFKVDCTNALIYQNRRQLLSHVNHAMTDDPRRNFMFGVTIEDDMVSLWFFSRSHSVKATVFSLVERPDLLIGIFVFLFCATDKQLGLDPLVTLIEGKHFLYHLPPNETRIRSQYYLTSDCISEYRPLRLRGRATRVWRVKQVKSATDHRRVDGTADMILKDVSVSSDAPTENFIQSCIFRDMANFSRDPNWRARDILRDCTEEELDEIAGALEREKFRSFFSCVTEYHIGTSGPLVIPSAWRIPAIFVEPKKQSQRDSKVHANPGPQSTKGTSMQPCSQVNPTPAVDHIPQQVLVPRKQCRYVYGEVYTPLNEIQTLGEAIDVLKGCIMVLRLMFCVGWVHRDISDSNILAARTGPNGLWRVKLADLEYAKRFPSNRAASTTPKTASQDFLACEILSSRRILAQVNTGRRGGAVPVVSSPQVVTLVHNFVHDLEAIWWILLWLITKRVKQLGLERDFVDTLFGQETGKLDVNSASNRWNIFTLAESIAKHNDVVKALPSPLRSNFIAVMDLLRVDLQVDYQRQHRERNYHDPGSYSWVVNVPFRAFFNDIEGDRDQWAGVRLILESELKQERKGKMKEEPLFTREGPEHGQPVSQILQKRKFSEDTVSEDQLEKDATISPAVVGDLKGREAGTSISGKLDGEQDKRAAKRIRH